MSQLYAAASNPQNSPHNKILNAHYQVFKLVFDTFNTLIKEYLTVSEQANDEQNKNITTHIEKLTLEIKTFDDMQNFFKNYKDEDNISQITQSIINQLHEIFQSIKDQAIQEIFIEIFKYYQNYLRYRMHEYDILETIIDQLPHKHGFYMLFLLNQEADLHY